MKMEQKNHHGNSQKNQKKRMILLKAVADKLITERNQLYSGLNESCL